MQKHCLPKINFANTKMAGKKLFDNFSLDICIIDKMQKVASYSRLLGDGWMETWAGLMDYLAQSKLPVC